MKFNRFLTGALCVLLLSLVACDEKDFPFTPSLDYNDTIVVAPADSVGEYITIAEALNIIAKLDSGASTTEMYKLEGEVIQNNTNPSNVPTPYNNINITIKDSTGTIGCWYMNNLNNQPFTSSSQVPLVGSKVVMIGKLKNYVNKNTGATTPEMANGYILRIIEMADEPDAADAQPITIAEAIQLANQLASGETTAEYYVDTVIITAIKTKAENVPGTYTNINMTVQDSTGSMDSYYTNYLDNKPFTSSDQIPAVGSKIVLIAKICNYRGTTPEFKDGYIAQILEEGTGTVDPGDNPGTDVELEGDGSLANPFTASDIMKLNNSKTGNYYVRAYVVGCIKASSMTLAGNVLFEGFDSQTNIVIAAAAEERDENKVVPVALPAGVVRDGLNLVGHPEYKMQEVLLYGSLEKYFGRAGVKAVSYAKVGDVEIGTNPDGSSTGDPTGGNPGDATDDPTDVLLNETMLTQASFGLFTAQSVSGDQAWTLSTKYGATMSGYANSASHANEDWLVSPAFDATGRGAVLTFDHARGPAGSMSVSTDNYTVWVSNDYDGDVTTATWTQMPIPTHGTAAWGYVSSGNMPIPAANCAANCRIAFKYVCNDSESATWEIKNIVVK